MRNASYRKFLIAAATLGTQSEALIQPFVNQKSRPNDLRLRLSSRTFEEISSSEAATAIPPIRRREGLEISKPKGENLIKDSDAALASLFDEEEDFTPFQTFVRATTALTALTYVVVPDVHVALDGAVAAVYDTLHSWGPANAPLFEAEVASFGFFLWIASFSGLHLILGPEKTKASRFDGKMPTKPFEWAMTENYHLWFNPLGSYLGSIWLYHTFLHEKAPLPDVAPSFGVLSIELLFGVFLYDMCFFPLHYLMHKCQWGQMRKVHGYHHRVTSHTLNSLETVQHSYLDGFLQVATNVIVQQISPFGGFGHKHVLTRLLHNLVVTYLLSEAHSGYNLPWMSHRIFPELLGGAPRHERHHHDGRVYYQQYFKYLDDLFGFTDGNVKKTISAKARARNNNVGM